MPSYKDLLGIKDGYYFWPKYSEVKITPYFKTSEFSCKCHNVDCNEQRISIKLIEKLSDLRVALGAAITITSGFRCSKHQQSLRGQGIQTAKGQSTHELGDACDIQAKDMVKLEQLLPKYFDSIGTAKTFYHVDLRVGKRRWVYV